MSFGYTYPIFVRAKHFRLGEKSGRSPVVYGVFYEGERKNDTSYTVSARNISLAITNGRSPTMWAYTDFTLSVASGPSILSTNSDTSQFETLAIGPSYETFWSPQGGQTDDYAIGRSIESSFTEITDDYAVGPSIDTSGNYQAIKLVNRFGHRTEEGGIRGFNDAQTQPAPDNFEFIVVPEQLRQDAFAVWLDAASVESGKLFVNTDNSVVAWTNKAPSGTSWLPGGDPSNRPEFIENARNGLGGISFDGVSQYLTNSQLNLASSSGEIYIVAEITELPFNTPPDTVWSASQSNVADQYLELRPWVDIGGVDGPEIAANNTAGEKALTYDDAILESGVPYIWTFRSEGQGMPWEVYVNGSGFASTIRNFAAHDGVWHGSLGGINTINIGASNISDTLQNFWWGTLYEIVGYEAQITEGVARTGIINLLAEKWQVPVSGHL